MQSNLHVNVENYVCAAYSGQNRDIHVQLFCFNGIVWDLIDILFKKNYYMEDVLIVD